MTVDNTDNVTLSSVLGEIELDIISGEPRVSVNLVSSDPNEIDLVIPGTEGPQGVPGPTGPVGTPGALGPTGPTGPVGVPGPLGPTGSQGAQGQIGATGPRGATGPTGPVGPSGLTGNSGASVSIIGTTPQTAPTAPLPGQIWIVGTPVPGWVPPAMDGTAAAVGDGVKWTGTGWSNIGPIRGTPGPAGTPGEPGEPGIPGPAGPDGQPTYTWIKYGDSATGAGLSDSPTGKTYIGIAYNKSTDVESAVATDYEWSLFQGPPGSDAAIITLTATSQVLAVPASGSTTTPATTTVTGAAINTTIINWTYGVDGATYSGTVPAGVSRTGNSVTITGATMTAKTISVKAADAAGNADTMTIAKISDGAAGGTGPAGADAYTILLTNEAQSFAGTATAAVSASATSQVIAYKGVTQIPATIGAITGQVAGISTALTNNGTTTAGFTIDVTSALTAVNGTLTVPITADGKSFTKAFAWSLSLAGAVGSQGIQGPTGPNGQPMYTWLKYADTPTTGMSDLPAGKTYMGLAYNKTSSTESSIYTDYGWSLIQGPQGNTGVQGPTGPNGQPTYTWIKYAPNGAPTTGQISDSPVGMSYIGIAYNKTTATESTVTTDYEWALIQGPPGPAGSQGIQGSPGITYYTWLKYASSATPIPADMSDSPTGKTWMGIAVGQTSAIETTVYTDYTWSLIQGPQGNQGIPGTPGADGVTTYTWVKYAPNGNPTAGQIVDVPAGMTYIGLAFNKTTPTETTIPTDYQWSLIQGPQGPQGSQGIQGPVGANGLPTYTWIKYADTPTTGMNDDPTGKKYMGIAYNKTTQTEDSVNYNVYEWSLIQGPQGNTGIQGPIGPNGQPTYTWIKYAPNGAPTTPQISDSPVGMTYMGIAYNKTTAAESTITTDYEWSLIQGPPGPTGSQGIQGPTGANGASLYTWLKYADTPTTGMSDLPAGKTYMGVAYNKTSSTESSIYTDYDWSLIQGPQGNMGIQGPAGANGQPTYTWVKYADDINGGGLVDTPAGKPYIGFAFNKTTAVETTVPTDYTWSLIQGPQGPQGSQGVPGAAAPTISLTATSQVLAVPAAGGATTPATTTVTGVATNTTITAWTYSVDGSATFLPALPAGVSRTGNVVTITGTTMTARAITIKMADAAGLADTFTVVKVSDGATGSTGGTGAPGVGVTGTTVTYQVGSTGTTAPTGTWVSSPQATSPGQFLWTRTVTTFSDTTSSTAYSVSAHGTSGSTGAPGVGVTGTAVTYQVGSTGTTAPVGTWQSTPQATIPGQFLWTRTITTYSDTTTSTAYSVSAHGSTGATGAAGADAYTVVLSNESQTFTAGTTNAQAATATTTVIAYKGTVQQTATVGTITGGATGITAAVTSNGTVAPLITFTVTTALVTANGTFTVPVTVGGITFNQVFSWSLSFAGPIGANGVPGTPAATISLTSTSQVLTSPATGGATTPTTAVVTGTPINTTITVWDYSVDGGVFSTSVPTGVSRSGNVVTVTGGTVTARTIAVRMSDANGVADTLTVAKSMDGSAGADAYTVQLTNEAQVFPGSTTAAVAGSTTSQVLAYKGTVQQTATIGTITGQVTGLTTALTNNGTTAAGFTVTVTTALVTTSGSLTVPITVGGITFTKTFSWSLGLTGSQGVQGPIGPNGQQLYTWVKYADTPTTGMSDLPAGKPYLGIAYNKTTATESSIYTDYEWNLTTGPQGNTGLQGPTGPNGQPTYTWIKYATSATPIVADISDLPAGKTYIGIAYNKTTATETTVPTDYEWSLIQGPQGPQGSQGVAGAPASTVDLTASTQVLAVGVGGTITPATATVTAVATNTTIPDSTAGWQYSVDGAAFSGTVPPGVSRPAASNVVTITGSTMTAKTIAVKAIGASGNSDTLTVAKVSDGATGSTGSTGPAGADAYTVLLSNESQGFAAGLTNALAGSATSTVIAYKGTVAQTATVGTITGGATGITAAVTNNGTTAPLITFTVTTALSTATGTFTIPVTVGGLTFNQIFSWSLAFTGATGSQGIQGPTGANGLPTYTWLKYADTPSTGMSDLPAGKIYMGLAYNKSSATESSIYTDYDWSLIQGPQGNQGVQGPIGPNGQPTYTWIKYGNDIIRNGDFAKLDTVDPTLPADWQRSVNGMQWYNAAHTVAWDATEGALALTSGLLATNGATAMQTLDVVPGDVIYLRIRMRSTVIGDGSGIYAILLNAAGTTEVVRFTSLQPSGITTSYADYSGVATVPAGAPTAVRLALLSYNKAVGIKVFIKEVYHAVKNVTDSAVGTHMGLAYNQTTAVESTDANLYEWTQTQGPQGLPGSNAATITLTSTAQVLVSPASGTGATAPATATITGTPVNTTITVWDYSVNSGAWSGTAPPGVSIAGNVVTITGATMTASTIAVRAGNNAGVADSLTVAKVLTGATGATGGTGPSGPAGADAYTVLLSNESQSFPAGLTNALATTATTTVIAYKGTVAQVATVGTITGGATGITAAVTNNGTTAPLITFTVTTALATATGTFTIPVTVGGMTFNQVFTWALSFTGAGGATGAAATIVDLTATTQALSAPAPTILDSFNRGDSTTSLGTTETGQAWRNDNSSVWGVSGGKAYIATAGATGGQSYADVECGTADVTVSFVITGLLSGGIAFRHNLTNLNGYVLVINNNGSLQIYRSAGAYGAETYTTIGQSTALAVLGDKVSITASGSTLQGKINDVTVVTATDATYTGTRHGLYNFGVNAGRLDNFTVAPATTTPATAVITGTPTGTTISTWTFSADGGTFGAAPIYASVAGNVVTVTGAIMTAKTLAIKATGASGVTDTMTISKISDGSSGFVGADAVTVVLTNEAQVFPGTVSAAVAGFTTSQVLAYKGAVQQSATIGTITGAPTGMTITYQNNPGLTAQFTATVTTALVTQSGTLTVPITVGGVSFTKTFAWSVSYTGAQGSTGGAGAQGVSITAVTPYYATVTPVGAAAPAVPVVATPVAPWVPTEPGYLTNTELYTTNKITYSNLTFTYTGVSKSSSYTAASQALPKISLIGANGKLFRDVTSYANAAGNLTGNIVIDTPITFTNRMYKIKLSGFNYASTQGTFNLETSGYSYAGPPPSVANATGVNTGNLPIGVRVARRISTGTLVIILTSQAASNYWQYPKITAVDAEISHTLPPDTWQTGWNTTLVPETDIPAASGIFDLLLTVASSNVPATADSAYNAATPDALAPASSPAATVTGSVSSLGIKWPAILNHDTVTYEVHCATTGATFTPSAATLQIETTATSYTIREQLADGTFLVKDGSVTYYVRIVAKDAKIGGGFNSAAPGTAGSATLRQITEADISDGYIYTNLVDAIQIKGAKLDADLAIIGKIKTAESGQRMELSSEGLRQYGSDGVSIRVDLPNDPQKPSVIDAQIMARGLTVGQGMDVRGQSTFAMGSKTILQTQTVGATSGPSLGTDYPQSAFARGQWCDPFWGFHLDSAESTGSFRCANTFFDDATMKKGTTWWQVPRVANSNGETAAYYTFHGNSVIAVGGLERQVTNGFFRTAGYVGARDEKYMITSWDDSAMNTSGTLAPIKKAERQDGTFSWFWQWRLGRCFSATGATRAHMVAQAKRNMFAPWPGGTIELATLAFTDTTITPSATKTINSSFFAQDEDLCGVTYGSSQRMGFETTDRDIWVIHGTVNNYVFTDAASPARLVDLEFPAVPATRSVSACGDVLTGAFTRFTAAPATDGPQFYNYTGITWAATDPSIWWGAFTWYDSQGAIQESNASAYASITMKKRARLTVTVPDLPDPAAGKGTARTVNDVNSFRFYLTRAALNITPIRTDFILQPEQPAFLPSGVGATYSTVSTPNFVGAVGDTDAPPLLTSFIAASPASWESNAPGTGGFPKIKLTGDGVAHFETLDVGGAGATSFTGKAFEQLYYSIRAQSQLSGGGVKVVDINYNISWSARFMPMSIGRSVNLAPSGYFEITMPPVGTVIPNFGGATQKTVTSAGVPMSSWDVLWYEIPFGSAATSLAANFRYTNYLSDFTVPNNWVLVAYFNIDAGRIEWATDESMPADSAQGGGWNSFAYGAGWGAGNIVPAYKIIGEQVYFRGTFSRASGSGTTMATIPLTAGRPVISVNLLARNGTNTVVNCQISSGGGVTIGTVANGDVIYLTTSFLNT
jgi:hypothetical protein